jgi:hypothetical protein
MELFVRRRKKIVLLYLGLLLQMFLALVCPTLGLHLCFEHVILWLHYERTTSILPWIIDMQHLYKNHLQNYAQKRNLSLPVYSCEREGPPHASRFKCKVTIDGQTYESPEFFATLKDAEHAAAKVALTSLSPDGVKEASLLFPLAIYMTSMCIFQNSVFTAFKISLSFCFCLFVCLGLFIYFILL